MRRLGVVLFLVAASFITGIMVGGVVLSSPKAKETLSVWSEAGLHVEASSDSLFDFFSDTVDAPLLRYGAVQAAARVQPNTRAVSHILGWALFLPPLEEENDRWSRESLAKLFARYVKRVPQCVSAAKSGIPCALYMLGVHRGTLFLAGSHKARMFLQLCGSYASISTLAGWGKLLRPDPCLAEKGAVPEIDDSYKRYTLVAVWTAVFGVPWMRLAAIHFLQALHKKEFETAGEWVWWWLQNWRKYGPQVSPDERPPQAVTLELFQLFNPPDRETISRLRRDMEGLKKQPQTAPSHKPRR